METQLWPNMDRTWKGAAKKKDEENTNAGDVDLLPKSDALRFDVHLSFYVRAAKVSRKSADVSI